MAKSTNDPQFLEWLLIRAEDEQGDIAIPLIGIPDGTKKGGEGYSFKEIVEGMRTGEPRWQPVYETMYNLYRKEYEASKNLQP